MNKDYFKYGLYAVGFISVLAVVYLVFRAFKRGQQGIATIGDTIQDNRNNTVIANQSGLTVNEVDTARKIAKDIATELETNKDMTSWEKMKHIVTDAEVIDILSQVKSAAMMRAVGNIYQNEMTRNKNLKNDLKEELTNSNFLNKIPFVEVLK